MGFYTSTLKILDTLEKSQEKKSHKPIEVLYKARLNESFLFFFEIILYLVSTKGKQSREEVLGWDLTVVLDWVLLLNAVPTSIF